MTFTFAGLKTLDAFPNYDFLAYSSNGALEITSYIRRDRGRRIHGWYDYFDGTYHECVIAPR